MRKHKKKSPRRRVFVDRSLQSQILLRVSVYFSLVLILITIPLSFFSTILDPTKMWIEHVVAIWEGHWPVFAMLALILPVLVYDLLRFSHRFVGPIYRLRRELLQFRETGKVTRIRFRKDDFWQDLADGINALTARIAYLEHRLSLSKKRPARSEGSWKSAETADREAESAEVEA